MIRARFASDSAASPSLPMSGLARAAGRSLTQFRALSYSQPEGVIQLQRGIR